MAAVHEPQPRRATEAPTWFTRALEAAQESPPADLAASTALLKRVLATETGRVGWLLGFLTGSALLEEEATEDGSVGTPQT